MQHSNPVILRQPGQRRRMLTNGTRSLESGA